MIILGVDGSLTHTGLAVVETDEAGVRDRLLWSGTIVTVETDGDHVDRFIAILRGVVGAAGKWSPDLIALEWPFVDPSKSAQTALMLGGLDWCLRVHLRLHEFRNVVTVAPASRLAAVGIKSRGRHSAAIKADTIALVLRACEVAVNEHEADAYAVAKAGLAKWRKGQRQAEQLALGIPAGRRVAKRGNR